MWREAVLAALVLHLSQGSQIPIGVKSHMLGLGGGGGGSPNKKLLSQGSQIRIGVKSHMLGLGGGVARNRPEELFHSHFQNPVEWADTALS